jgi:hypothetical protein
MKMTMMFFRRYVVLATALGLIACSGASAPDGSAAASNAGTATSTAPAAQSGAAPPVQNSALVPSAAAVVPPAPSASAVAEAPPVAPSASASSAAAAEEAPIPKVKVKNIGMHIGGGPNDDVTKEPIKRSVEPHFDAFRRCFAKVDDQAKGGDFGVDVLIEGAGGKAKITHPRTALKGAGFEACVVSVFEAVEFLRPKGGQKTMVSYSIRFTP